MSTLYVFYVYLHYKKANSNNLLQVDGQGKSSVWDVLLLWMCYSHCFECLGYRVYPVLRERFCLCGTWHAFLHGTRELFLAFRCGCLARVRVMRAIFYSFYAISTCICMSGRYSVYLFTLLFVVFKPLCIHLYGVFACWKDYFWHFAAKGWPG